MGGAQNRDSPTAREESASANGVNMSSPGFLSRRKVISAISQLNHRISNIQGEIDHLQEVCSSSTICQEFVLRIDSIPDPLLPVTKGPADARWYRWFKAANGSSGARKQWLGKFVSTTLSRLMIQVI